MILRTAAIFLVAWITLIVILKSKHAESGCRMAYMRPDYIPHSQFVDSKHAMTYGLYLYRDRAWNLNNDISVRVFLNKQYLSYDTLKPNGIPVLFIPGNAGSYKQGRSIAAELAKQYYSSYGIPNPYLESQAGAPPDFWTGGSVLYHIQVNNNRDSRYQRRTFCFPRWYNTAAS